MNGLCLLCAALFLVSEACTSRLFEEKHRKPTTVQVGDYLRDDYLERLKSTRSPYRAGMLGPPQHVSVLADGSRLRLTPGFNFHEGGPDFSLQSDGSLSQKEGFLPVANLSFAITDSTHFTLGFDEHRSQAYTFVGELYVYIRNLVLAGDYADSGGRHYLFRNDGIAIFPDRRFSYQVGVDHVFSDFDYFTNDVNPEAEFFGFKRTGDRLDIFRTSGELSQYIDAKPMLTLHECCKTR